MKSLRRWRLLHLAPATWGREPERHTTPLAFVPGHDSIAFATPTLLVIRTVGTSSFLPDVCGVDPLSGEILWRFSEEVGESLLLHCHTEEDTRIVATTPKGIYLLEREGPRAILKRDLEPTSIARFVPDGSVGFVLDANNQLLAFSQKGRVLWSRKPRSRRRFQNPFPLEDGSVCLSATEDIVRLDARGKRVWTWSGVSRETPHANQQSRYSIAAHVVPDLLLVRSVEEATIHHLMLGAQEGDYRGHLGDVWPYGADGVAHYPMVMLDGQEQLAFLQDDNTVTEPQKIKSMFGKFCRLPAGKVALYYDAMLKAIVCADAEGKVLWRESYPDAEKDLAAMSFMEHTAFFATPAGQLHVWDWFSES